MNKVYYAARFTDDEGFEIGLRDSLDALKAELEQHCREHRRADTVLVFECKPILRIRPTRTETWIFPETEIE